jgi:hypothetical protein
MTRRETSSASYESVTDLALLTLPSANRVYGRDLGRLAQAEIAAVAPALHGALRAQQVRAIGGVEYIVLTIDGFDDHDRFVLSNLSAAYALFALTDGDTSLRPLDMQPLAFFDSDLITMQRYSGKTNEQFTHLLVNVAVAVSAAAHERRAQGLAVRLFDPLAGRGTTLNRGLMYGFDVAGVDLDPGDFEAYRTFLTTYLKDNRLSPTVERAAIRKGTLAGAKRCTMTIRRSQHLDVVNDDTVRADQHFSARSFDVLVGDLPYGIHHGSTSSGNLARSPADLVQAALPGWRGLLRRGAGLALAWNLKTFPRGDFEDMLRAAGFDVMADAESFDHRVDRSITRGIVLATTR